MPEAEIDRAGLDDEALVETIHDDIYEGCAEPVATGVQILLDRSWVPERVLSVALVDAMAAVGEDFRDGILYVPDVLRAAKAMKTGLAILKPLLAETGAAKRGTVLIGTVKGDIHDIGKNMVGMMMEGAGFDVVDLGVDTPAEDFLKAVTEHRPDIIALSALLTTTMPYMKTVIDAMVEEGVRADQVILIGGAPVTEAFAESVGADAYCRDAGSAVDAAIRLLTQRQASPSARPEAGS